jgi:transcription elongation factor GreB
MSKAFTREGDGDDDGAIPDEDLRLPPGARNYMTPAGAARLRAEIDRLHQGPRDPAVERRLRALHRRQDLAEIVDPRAQPADRALFGATVTVRDERGRERSFRIVGIDEADARSGAIADARSISWLSPIARALLDSRVGDTVELRGAGDCEVIAIRYE